MSDQILVRFVEKMFASLAGPFFGAGVLMALSSSALDTLPSTLFHFFELQLKKAEGLQQVVSYEEGNST